jgi:tetratricopeptide (TPR) repeat protein
MQVLTDATKRVAAGEGREVLLISGEAGLGKTTLVAEAARAAFDSGACVLFGHCEEDLATPYQLFAEAFRQYVTHAPEDQLRSHIEEHGSELSRLVPTLASRIPNLPPSKATDSDTERFLLFAAAVGLLTTVSQHQPVVLVLDDLQWADKGSLLLLRHLAAAEQTMRVLVLGTYRDSELSQSHPFTEALAALHRQRGVSRIELSGLDDSGVVSFLEAAAGQTLDKAAVGLAHAIYRETDGNPFFVSEVLRHLSETGAIFQDSTGRWVADDSLEQMALPDCVRVVIGARVGRLGPEASRVLSTAAVIGRDFDLDVLALATKTSEDELLDILDAAAAVALVRELSDATGHYTFAHALIQHTLYEDLGRTRRARVHRQVAEALEDLCGGHPGGRVGELARHWISATQPIDLAKAIGYSKQAGDSALDALAPADALGRYAQALDLYPQATDPDPVLGVDLAIGLGTAQRQTGDPRYRDTLLDAARRAAELGDTKRIVAAALASDRGFFSTSGGFDTDSVEVLEMALDLLPADDLDRAFVLAILCQEFTFGGQLASVAGLRGNLADLSSIVEQQVAEYPGLPSLLGFLANVYASGNQTDNVQFVLEGFAQSGFDLPLDFLWITGMTNYAQAAISCGDPRYAKPIFERLVPWSGQFGYVDNGCSGPIDRYLGDLASILGHFDEADAYFARAAISIDKVGAKLFAAENDLSWGTMLAQRGEPGDTEKARELLANAHSVAVANGYGNVERRSAAALQLWDG